MIRAIEIDDLTEYKAFYTQSISSSWFVSLRASVSVTYSSVRSFDFTTRLPTSLLEMLWVYMQSSRANFRDDHLHKDEGVGIPPDEAEAVFDAFVESSNTRSYAGGTGLGLSVAKEIVHAHKGKIWVEQLQDGEIGARVNFLLAS